MHIPIFVVILIIVLLFGGEEIVRHAFGGIFRFLACLIVIYALILAAGFASWGALTVFHGLGYLIGHDAATGLGDALVLIAIFVGLPAIWVDSRNHFAVTISVFRFLTGKKSRKGLAA